MATFSPITVRESLSVEELIALFYDRRCRYGAAVEWLSPRQLLRLELLRWEIRRGRYE